MQHEITEKQNLLNEDGSLNEAGFSKRHIQVYNRNHIKAHPMRIKEWDYYYIGNDDFGVALTIADNAYMGLDSISLLKFTGGEPWEKTTSPMSLMTLGKKHLPASTLEGNAVSRGKRHLLSFEHRGDIRKLSFYMEKFNGKKAIEGDITLYCPDMESMVIATPFDGDPKAFYYNQKINCMPAEGIVRYDGEEYLFDAKDSFGVLDWGRGVWTKVNTWFWSSASGRLTSANACIDGVPVKDTDDATSLANTFGWNLGYGFGDTSKAGEDMLFFEGKAHKLGRVRFDIPAEEGKEVRDDVMGGEDFLSAWTIKDDEGRLDIEFKPVIDRASKTDVKLISSDQHQVFGHCTGKAVLDDGRVIEIKDFMAFAEKVRNEW